jgi:hypothetical protein
MKFTLRLPMVGMWLLNVILCLAVTLIALGLYRLGATAEVRLVQAQTLKACRELQGRFERFLADSQLAPEMAVRGGNRNGAELLPQMVLANHQGVEGGFWSGSGGFASYAYPTYGSNVPKRDVPVAETGRIEAAAGEAIRTGQPVARHFDSRNESLVLCALQAGGKDSPVAVWAMSRAHLGESTGVRPLMLALGGLFCLALASGSWMLWALRRWSQRFSLLEASIATAPVEDLPVLPLVGSQELDRIVSALNHLNLSLKTARQEALDLSRSLAKAERVAVVGRLAAEIAHEIRNPIAAMRLRIENALAKPPGAHPAALEALLPEIRRLDDLLQRLLLVARLDELKPARVVLGDWLAGRVAAMAELAAKAGVDLELADTPETEWTFDPERMARALDNLLLNGIQHTPSGGRVQVSCSVDPDRCVLSVQDSGPGLPAGALESAFEPLRSSRPEGLGLGLGIAREIVAAHGGFLRCLPGARGARFEIELPWRTS